MKKNSFFDSLKRFIDGDVNFEVKEKSKKIRRDYEHKEISIKERYVKWHDERGVGYFKSIYAAVSVAICISIISILLITVSYLPPYGGVNNPVNNEVSERYIEKGMEETGAVNIVAGMILDYRAFDTFGESCVLFVAASSVLMLLRKQKKVEDTSKTDEEIEEEERLINPQFEPQRDPIIKNIAKILVPMALMYGVYIVLNGHLSPGGGFSGGAIMGASLVLYSSAYGNRKARKMINEKLVRNVTFFSLAFYAIAKGYSFFTGANHIPSGIPTGIPGNIISSGLILPLNIAVGLIVTCTMYSFYALFTKEEI